GDPHALHRTPPGAPLPGSPSRADSRLAPGGDRYRRGVLGRRVCPDRAVPPRSPAMKRTDPAVAAGRALFERLQCASCHRIHGEGGAIGPDLSYVGDQRDRDWLIKHFRDPQSTSPGSIMPKFPLSEQELNDLTAYMLSLRK